jgi:hypothetical protein
VRRIAAGTNAGFLAALYGDVLGRPLDPAGAQVWGQLLSQGATPPAAVAAAVLGSAEAAQDQAAGLYGQYLGRAADPGGLAWLTAALQQGLPGEAAAVLLLGSAESYQDAQ